MHILHIILLLTFIFTETKGVELKYNYIDDKSGLFPTPFSNKLTPGNNSEYACEISFKEPGILIYGLESKDTNNYNIVIKNNNETIYESKGKSYDGISVIAGKYTVIINNAANKTVDLGLSFKKT